MTSLRPQYYDSAQVRRPVLTELGNLFRYRGLIRLLVARDLTVRYKRSTLGVWWTLLNPLLEALVFWVVFAQIFARSSGSEVPYSVYLLSGILLGSYFRQGLLAAGSGIVNSRAILAKIYVPPEIFSFSAAAASAANFLLGLVPILLIQVVMGVGIPWTVVLVPIPTVLLLALAAGAGLIVASAAVRFYDVLDLTGVLAQLATFMIPTFYPLEIVPERFQSLIRLNPLFGYLETFRAFVYEGRIPSWTTLASMVAISAVVFVLGVWVFSRSWKRMAAAL